MENANDVLDEAGATGDGTPKRPPFLMVLCILTFVGSGLGLLGALFGLMASGVTEESLRLSQSILSNQQFGGGSIDFEEMMRWQKYMNLANLVGCILCLVGALMMWRMKKVGYYLYIPGWIIPVTVSAIGMEYMLTGWMASMGILGIIINVLFAAAFIIMYGLNFKHLK